MRLRLIIRLVTRLSDVLPDESSADGLRPTIRPKTEFISTRIIRLR